MLAILLALVLVPVAGTALADPVSLPVEAPQRRTVEYSELWRTDPYSDEYLMGNVQDATIDTEGNFYFLDTQLQEVFKFDAEGNYVATVAHKGEGPGELSQTWQISFWPPDQIILPRVFPPQIVRLSPDGTPLEELHVYRHEGDDTQASVSTLRPVADRAVVEGSIFSFGTEGARSIQWIGVVDRDGTVLHEFGDRERELSSDPMNQVVDEAAEFWEWDRWTVGPDGGLYRAPDREQWLIERYDLQGNLVATWTRDIPARKRTRDEEIELKNSRTFIFNGRKAEVTYKLLDTEPPIQGMAVVDGNLWVFHNLPAAALPEGVWRRASVISPDGELIEEVDLKTGHDPELDLVQLLADGRLMVIENGVAANQAQMAAFGVEQEEELDAEPAEIVIYAPRR